MVEVEAHGQELTDEFLDHLFVSIINDIPDRKWIEIKKNHDQVTAGIKHLIDMDMYGEKIEVVFSEDYTHFKKRKEIVPHESPFKNLPAKKFPPGYWAEQDKLAEERQQCDLVRERKRIEREGYQKPISRGYKG